MTAAIIVRQTKTAGWRVAYRATSGHEYVLDRRLTREAATRCAATAQAVYDVPVEEQTA